MPYFKCVPCKIRSSTARACPGCGLMLEPVARLTDVMGFRCPDLFDASIPPREAEQVADISGGRAAAETQLDADRWLDEGGSLAPELLAVAVALPKPS